MRWGNWPWTAEAPSAAEQRVAECVTELITESHTAQYVLIGRVLQMLDPEHKLGQPYTPEPGTDPLLGTKSAAAPPPPEPGQREPPG